MNLTLQHTVNNTLLLNYRTENPRLGISNRIFKEREKELNKIPPEVVLQSCIVGESIVDKFDHETNQLIHKTVYNSQKLTLRNLLAELKGLIPLYSDYTIIIYKANGEYYDESNGLIHWSFSSTEDIELENDENLCKYSTGLIGQSFTRLIDYLTVMYNSHNFAVMDFNVELLPNSTKRKYKRKRTNIPRGLRHEVFKRDDYKCVECGASKEDGATLHVDHKIPVAKGGTDELDNLQTLCSKCNLNKSDVIQ